MKITHILPAAGALALCAGAAFAANQPAAPSGQNGPGGGPGHHHHRMDPQKMAEHMKRMCANRYAKTVGGMAYLKTRLNLSGNQTQAFENWKDQVLSQAKSAADRCQSMTPPTGMPSLTDRLTMREHMLEARAEAIKAQMPALQNLTAALNQQQTRILDRAVMRVMHDGMGGHMGHDHDRGHGHWGHHDGRGMGGHGHWGHHDGHGMGDGMGDGNGPQPQGDNGPQ